MRRWIVQSYDGLVTMTETVERAIEELRSGFDGALILADEAGYDEARKLFNGMIDRRPAVSAQCSSVADVQRAIRFGRQEALEIAVRGGGRACALVMARG